MVGYYHHLLPAISYEHFRALDILSDADADADAGQSLQVTLSIPPRMELGRWMPKANLSRQTHHFGQLLSRSWLPL